MKLNDVFAQNDSHLTFDQQDKTIKKQLNIIEKLQKRVKAEQRRKNQLASQLKRVKQQQKH